MYCDQDLEVGKMSKSTIKSHSSSPDLLTKLVVNANIIEIVEEEKKKEGG